MVRCARCLYPSVKPDLAFDAEGICSACRNHEARPSIDWGQRKAELLRVIDAAEGRVLVPSSGGKDSTYIALRLKELGADVTAVTATTCHLSTNGRANIDSLARHVRTIEVTPNMTVRAKLNRIALDLVGDPSWPEHASIHRVPFKVAADMGFRAIFYGECPTDAYGGPRGTEDLREMTQRYTSEFSGFLGLRSSDFVGLEGITRDDMRDYTAPDDGYLKDRGIAAHFLGWFEEWDSHRNARVAAESGMRQDLPGPMNWWPHENQDNYQVSIHDAAMYRKFSYGRLTAQISVDIRDGLISRKNAIDIVREQDGLFPFRYLDATIDEICEHMGMTFDRLIAALDKHTNWALFAGVDNYRPIPKEFAKAVAA